MQLLFTVQHKQQRQYSTKQNIHLINDTSSQWKQEHFGALPTVSIAEKTLQKQNKRSQRNVCRISWQLSLGHIWHHLATQCPVYTIYTQYACHYDSNYRCQPLSRVYFDFNLMLYQHMHSCTDKTFKFNMHTENLC